LFAAVCRWEINRSVTDPDLRRRLTPDYDFGCKRPSMSNSYFKTYNQPHVGLITDGIDRLTGTGIASATGEHREYDAIVLATGFLMAWDPAAYRDRPIRGADGFDLGRHFAENKIMAYEGLTIPGMPNYFMSFSAYSGLSSWHPIVQVASKHLVRVLTECHRRNATRVEITRGAFERFGGMITERMAGALFFHRDCGGANSYYIDHHGDAPSLRPTSTKQAVRASRTFPLDDYAYARLPNEEPERPTPSEPALNTGT
jgi:cation diffusion facilitator CzcD-associated flavoprotein CzcO